MTKKCKKCGHVKGSHSHAQRKTSGYCLRRSCTCEKFEAEDDINKAVFEILHILDEKITKVNNRFSKLAKELGYKA